MCQFLLGWGEGGDAWKWRRRLLAWEEKLVGNVVLFYYQLFCRLIRMTGEFSNFMPLQNTTLVVFTTF